MIQSSSILIISVIFQLFISWHSNLHAAQDDLFLYTISNQYDKVRVVRVISADTIQLANDEKVRLIGLKALPAPERPEIERDQFGFVIKAEKPFMTIEEGAFNFVQTLLEGQDVRLEFDKQKKDENFHILAYVFLYQNDLFVNEQILEMGFADLQISPPNMKYAEIFRAAYTEARREKRGLHNSY